MLDELALVPYGQTTTYGALAGRVGAPRAARAVGTVMNRNPIPIVLPCHRVIGANGSLTGYGGGLDVKERLLRLEGALMSALGRARRPRPSALTTKRSSGTPLELLAQPQNVRIESKPWLV